MGAAGLIGAGAGMAMSIGGNNVSRVAGIEGSEANAKYQRMAMNFQNRIMDDEIQRFRPYWEAGKTAISRLNALDTKESIGGKYDKEQWNASASGETKQILDKATSLMGEDSRNFAGLNKDGLDDMQKNILLSGDSQDRKRLLDMVDVGMGAAGSAGRLTPDNSGQISALGSQLISSQQDFNTARQNMLTQSMDSASGLPAYLKYGSAKKEV